MTPLRERGAQAVADAWNASVPAKYRVDAALVEANLLGHPLLHEEASNWSDETFVAIKRSAAGLYDGPNRKTAHLSLLAHRPPSDDSPAKFPHAPVTAAIDTLREEGYDAIVVGQDSGHFLPGAPTDIPWLGWFLKGFGFERGGLSFDLEHDAREIDPRGESPSTEIVLRTLGEGDVESLDQFLAGEFPGRWRYDVGRKVDVEGPRTVFGLLVDGRVQGFAQLQEDGCRLPIGGANWRNDLGPAWGSLGPIGVSKALRGQSYGIDLLNAALVELRSRGARRTIIDWTGLVDFYGTQGFSVARTYRSYRLSLRADP